MNAREDWLTARRAGIGGSDIAAMLGLSKWKTPYELWLDKTGRETLRQADPAAEERMHFGNRLEDLVAREYAERTGSTVQRINGILHHPGCDIAMANIDRAIVEPGRRARWDDKASRVLGAAGVLECKTAHALALMGADWGDAGTDQVPEAYWLQCQWYLGITGLERSDLAVLFGGQEFRIYSIAADKVLFGELLDAAGNWWQAHVVADTPPQPSSEDEARQRFARSAAGLAQIVDAEVAAAVDLLADVKASIAAFEREEQRLRDQVCVAFGEAEEITHAGRRLASWKSNKDGSKTDWKGVCLELKPSAELIAAHTTTTPGARVLRLAKTPKE